MKSTCSLHFDSLDSIILFPMDESVQMHDAVWFAELRRLALKEWLCLEFIHDRCNGAACQQLHDVCGLGSLHSLKLKVFLQTFCKSYLNLSEEVDVQALSAMAGSSQIYELFTCNDDPSGSVLKVIKLCESGGWMLKTSCFG